jgi:hypothetical protein
MYLDIYIYIYIEVVAASRAGYIYIWQKKASSLRGSVVYKRARERKEEGDKGG